jgi:aryl-alcohol dehydrogenase-like predicted oxidoreductase
METVVLGKTDLTVSRIAFGTWQLGGEWGSFPPDDAVAAIRYARALGINLFDTAQAYGFGASERLLAAALRDELDHARNDVVIATKGGLRNTPDGLVRDSSPVWLRQGVEQSLEALGVDELDLYQIHWPDPAVPFAESAGALQELVDEGKIRYVGVSNFDVDQLAEFGRTTPVASLQLPYHLFRQDAARELLPFCVSQDIGVLVYGPLAHGLLSGRMHARASFPPGDWRRSSPIFRGEPFASNLEAVGALQSIARELGTTVSKLAIAWVLGNAAVDVAIVGTRNADHIADAVAAVDLMLWAADRALIEEAMAHAVPVGGPSPEAMP